jgi:hypothetical protein
MRKIAVVLVLFFSVGYSYSQKVGKSIKNFITVIDNKIPFQGDLNLQIEIDEGNRKDTFIVEYIPGDISMDESLLMRLQSERVKSITLLMHYTRICNNEAKSYHYNIEFKKNWLQYSFVVLRIYNLDSKENRKTFYPLEGKEFTYEIDTPNGSQTRVRKRNTKKVCN